jgi:hypothetical protein
MGVDLPSRYKGDMEELELDDVYMKMNSPKVVFDVIRTEYRRYESCRHLAIGHCYRSSNDSPEVVSRLRVMETASYKIVRKMATDRS